MTKLLGRLSILVVCFGALVFLDTLCLRASANDLKPDDAKATTGTVDTDIGAEKEASRTDTDTVKREEEAILLDGLNVAQMRELREKAQKQHFEAEVNRMMKIIINSLYKNKEIFVRELISNASDALDKIRFLSLMDKSQLDANPELSIHIKSNPEAKTLHFVDSGIGMTAAELSSHLGTIAKSGTSEFFERFQTTHSENEQSDLIGQFGVGFYSSFLVADRVTVVSKHNNESTQHIWESDATSNDFTVVDDPRGSTIKRGTEVILHLKEEAKEYLDVSKLKEVIKKYSQFINFNIYLWTKKTEMVEEPVVEEEKEKAKEEKKEGEEEAKVEEEKKDEHKTKKVEKTTWDWELINDTKPIWTRKPNEVEEAEYASFYKALGHETDDPLAHIHFTAEGEVAFKSILYVPKSAPFDMFQSYGKKSEFIKLYVRRVFITDNFEELMPKYLVFIKGVVDSDDLPLNVSRETLQQHKLLKVIKKKLVRKVIEMLKKLDKADYEKFWKEYSTNIKLGVIEDQSNRSRLAPLLRFLSSHSTTNATSLEDYISRMKEKQEFIYYIAGSSLDEVKKSPFVEKLVKRGYEVLYLPEPVDEYCIQSLPEFKSKKFANAAKEGLKMVGDDSASVKEHRDALDKDYKSTLDWLKDVSLKDKIEKAVISERLVNTPCALVASQYGWSGNMERIMRSQAYAKTGDPTSEYYLNQKKIFELNPRHPLVKELHQLVQEDKENQRAKELAELLFDTATLRSGFYLKDSTEFAERVERMLRASYGISPDAKVEEEPEPEPAEEAKGADEIKPEVKESEQIKPEAADEHEEL